MALIRCNHFARTLGMAMHLHAIIPEHATEYPVPVLWLLHGLSDDDSIWSRRTSLERYAEQYRVAIIMPNGHRSFYTNMANGYAYWDYLSEELPTICHRLFPLSRKRDETFVAGLSMGGYGALKLGLRQWERFSHIASLSGVTEIASYIGDPAHRLARDMSLIHGAEGRTPQPGNDPFELVSQLAKRQSKLPLPRLYQACGTEDHLYAQGLRFRDHARQCGFEVHYEDGPGKHDWAFWDRHIQQVLAWLPLAP